MGSWFKKHVSKPSKAVVKGIVRTPTNIAHSVKNVIRNPLDLKAWGNVALQVNPVTAIPRSIVTEGGSTGLNRKVDLLSGIGATALVSAGVGTMAKAGIASASALASGGTGVPTTDAGETSFSDYPEQGQQLLENTPVPINSSNDYSLTDSAGKLFNDVLNKGANSILSTGTGLKTNLQKGAEASPTTASMLGNNKTLLYVVFGAGVIGMIMLGMGNKK